MALSYVTSTSGSGTASSAAPAVPGGMSANDLVVIVFQIYNPADGATVTAPGGFQAIGGANYHMTTTDTTGDRWLISAWYKFVSGDSGTYSSFSWGTSAAYNYEIDVIRGAPTGGPIDNATTQATVYSGSLPAAAQTWCDGSGGRPAFSTGQANEIVVAVLANDYGYHSQINTAGWNMRVNDLGIQIEDKTIAASGSIGSITTGANNACDQSMTFIAIRVTGAPTCSVNPVISDTTSAGRWREGDNCQTTDGTWTGSPTSYAYQWKRDTSPISGGTTNAYTLAAADVGHQITMTVTATNAGGATAATSDPTGTVTTLGSAPTGVAPPGIAGTPMVFQTLTVTTGTWNNTPTGFGYQWRKNSSNIGGGTVNAYTIPFSDLAGTIDCVVAASNASGTAYGTASPVGPVTGSLNTPVVGQVLTGQYGQWSNSPTSYSCQWLQDGGAIGGGTTQPYTIQAADTGHSLAFRVVAHNAAGDSLAAVSASTGTVVTAPANTVVPAIIGLAQQGQTLSTDNGTWSNNPTSYTYQWKRNGSNIGGATNGSYTLVAGDVTNRITVTVTASNLVGSASATSAQTAVVVASGTGTFAISLNASTKVISWSAYTGATGYQTAASNGDRTNASRTTTYGGPLAGTTWAPSAISGQTMYYGVGAMIAGGTVIWCDSEVSIAWPASAMAIGVNIGDFGGNTSFGPSGGLTEAQDLAQGGIDWVRASVDEFPNAADLRTYYLVEPLQAIVCKAGPYSSGGVSALVGSDSGQSWASAALSLWQTAGVPSAKAPVFEILNEPYGPWFFGSNANSQANAEALGQLVKTTYTTFHNALGSNSPKIIAPVFGNGPGVGQPVGATPSWWNWLYARHSDIASYYDGVVMHPYGGTGDRTLSGQGDRNGITSANQVTGKPVYVTEVGWPTALQGGNSTPTGDSLQWTDAEQATNIGNFLTWAKGTGYVAAVMIYHHYDTASPAFYGIIYGTSNPTGTAFRHKPSFAVVGAA